MAGYTNGVETQISEQSMTMGLNRELLDISSDLLTHPEGLLNALQNNEDLPVDSDDVDTLLSEGIVYLDEGGALETDGDGNLYHVSDWADIINELSEGGMVFITDTDKEILGARMSVAGEHLGDVSVVADTYTRTVSGHGKTLPLSDDDCNAINDFLNDVYA